ncbi:glutamine amidotransferase [Allopseudospirillum japonicum]|uniref:Imidazole glycerol phosphate synthase subunit HisH n=1 Tax=Allopseudospirillum japonicum TaxID=64971 RepID=A0A1H6REG5_9GAMM|nr:imidazole glycerol phosphate synthase subunit HisH [Allopseudospirillum japonicum]SEI50907.1 glutamine amidotransferase [Allopseudospirillum japonicum]
MSLIAVVDYGMGNLHSVAKALEKVAPDARVQVTSDAQTLAQAERVVLPGVGAIRDCVGQMYASGLVPAIKQAMVEKPFLGICVGMQALFDFSEENQGVECLKVLPGRVNFFGDPLLDAQGQRCKVPHMGWNQVQQTQNHPIWAQIADLSRFYFVHSYYVKAATATDVIGQVQYADITCDAVVARDNLVAVQFHPEKSAQAGLQLLANFTQWRP